MPHSPRLRFGAFLAPHHPLGEHPMLMFRRDIELAALLDRLGYDEYWVGEHHSTGWEVIASPEMFLASVGEHTAREVDAFLDGEQRGLAGIGGDGNDHPLKQARRPAHQVGVTVGDRVEGARVDRVALHGEYSSR